MYSTDSVPLKVVEPIVTDVPLPVEAVTLVELPITVDEIVPVKFPAVRLVKLAPDTAPNEPDHVPEVIVPTDVRLDAVMPEPSVVALRTDVPLI